MIKLTCTLDFDGIEDAKTLAEVLTLLAESKIAVSAKVAATDETVQTESLSTSALTPETDANTIVTEDSADDTSPLDVDIGTTSEKNVADVLRDAQGTVWNDAEHSTPPKLTTQGLWRKRRGIPNKVEEPEIAEATEIHEVELPTKVEAVVEPEIQQFTTTPTPSSANPFAAVVAALAPKEATIPTVEFTTKELMDIEELSKPGLYSGFQYLTVKKSFAAQHGQQALDDSIALLGIGYGYDIPQESMARHHVLMVRLDAQYQAEKAALERENNLL